MTAHVGGAALLSERSLLRTQLRAQRRAIPPHERASASRQFARILRRSQLLRPGRRIAVYVAHDHEADPQLIVRLARRNRCELYLPAIADYRRRRMEFRRYTNDGQLRRNRYGIPEPERSATRIAVIFSLETVFAALAGFLLAGDRLGVLGLMGCAAIFAGIVIAEPAAAAVLRRLVAPRVRSPA